MTLIINSTNESREIIVFRSTFDMLRKEILLQMESVTEIKRGSDWIPYKVENAEQGRLVRLNNNSFVDPETELIVIPELNEETGEPDTTGLVGTWDYLMRMSGADIGMTNLSDNVFDAVADKLESFVAANSLHI